jgi:F-type H+-transporting ATPase subunit c
MKLMQWFCLVVVVFVVGATPALAQETTWRGPQTAVLSGQAVAAGLGMGLTIIGAGYGLGRIGSAAMEGMARQPEISARIQTGMLIIAAMLEGATLASVVLCYLVGSQSAW